MSINKFLKPLYWRTVKTYIVNASTILQIFIIVTQFILYRKWTNKSTFSVLKIFQTCLILFISKNTSNKQIIAYIFELILTMKQQISNFDMPNLPQRTCENLPWNTQKLLDFPYLEICCVSDPFRCINNSIDVTMS